MFPTADANSGTAPQPRDVAPEHQPDLAQPDLGDEPLEGRPAEHRGGRAPEVIVDGEELLMPLPNWRARSASAYCRRTDSRFCSTWRTVD